MSALRAGEGESFYLKTRGEAEAKVKSSPLAWTIFRPSVIFGPGDGLFFRFASLLRMTPVLPLARAHAKFTPVYVGDVAEAFARAIAHPHAAGHTYELFGPRVIELGELVRWTAALIGKRRWILALPDALGGMQAFVGEWLPGKPISRDNFRSLKVDSVGHDRRTRRARHRRDADGRRHPAAAARRKPAAAARSFPRSARPQL